MVKNDIFKTIESNKEIVYGVLLLITILFTSVQVSEITTWRLLVVGGILLLIDLKTWSKITEAIGGIVSSFVVFFLFPFPSNIFMGLGLGYAVSRPLGPLPLGTIFLAIVYSIGKFLV